MAMLLRCIHTITQNNSFKPCNKLEVSPEIQVGQIGISTIPWLSPLIWNRKAILLRLLEPNKNPNRLKKYLFMTRITTL